MLARRSGSHLSSLKSPPASRNESKVGQELYFRHGQPGGQASPDKDGEEDKGKEETMQRSED